MIDLSWFPPRCLVGLLSLFKISSTDGTEIARASAYIESQQLVTQAKHRRDANPPFTAALSSLCSTELPSAAVSFLDFPENTPATAPKMFRLRPAFTVGVAGQL